MIVQANKNKNTLMLVILRYSKLCIFFLYPQIMSYKLNKICASCTHSAVLGSDGLQHHFCAKFTLEKKYTLVQEMYSSHRCVVAVFFSTVALYSSGLHCVAKKNYKRRTWHKDRFPFTPVSCTVPAPTCVLTTLALVLCLPTLSFILLQNF